MTKIKKYESKSDKIRGRISSEYAEYLQQKQKNKKWKKKIKKKVIQSLPFRLASKFETYDFSKFNDKKIKSLFIFGEPGTGKTVLSAYYYMDFIRQLYLIQGEVKLTYNFVVYTNMIEDFKRDFATANDIIQEYMKCDLLVIDDFGAKKPTDYVFERIYLLINERYLNMLPTIINSNFSLEDISKQLEDFRIVRRIEEDYELIKKI